MRLHSWAPLGAALLLLVLWAPAALADGTESINNPDPPFAIAAGSEILSAGVGLDDTQPGDITVVVPAGASVEQVILYWGGTNEAEGDKTDKDTITLDGSILVEGDFIGGNTQYSNDEWTVSYRADITGLGLVGPGSNTISVEGLDFTDEQYGAGVLVIIDNGTPAVVEVRDGNDYAHIRNTGDLLVTVPQTFSFVAASFPRTATIDLLVGSVADDGGSLGFRPNSIEVTVGAAAPMVFSDELASTSGRLWDVWHKEVNVPAGDTSVTVQLFSRNDSGEDTDCSRGVEGLCPASMVWTAAGLSIEEPLCALGDLVWLDDGDGIQEPGEPGIADVELSLTSSCDDGLLDVTSTDSEGFYLFDGLACDCTYTVTVNESSSALGGLDQTLVYQGEDACLDSSGVEETTTLTPLDPEDLCLDFGFVEPTGGGEGCTPGYWKQPQHFGSYANPPLPDTLFSAVFEDAFPGMTLVQVLAQGGGGLNALGRHTVAAMLNGASADVDYDLTDSEVISMFNDVYPGTKDEYNALKSVFSGFNEQMCPLGRADLDGDRPSRTRTRRVRRR